MSISEESNKRTPFLRSLFGKNAIFLIFPLLLVGPFLNFTRVIDYPFFAPATALIAVALIVAGILIAHLVRRSSLGVRNLVLLALVVFYLDLEFELFRSEWAGVILVMATVAIFVVGIGERLWTVLTCMVATMTATTFALAVFEVTFRSDAAGPNTKPILGTSASLPPILHIVFDEHIGLDGLSRRDAEAVSLRNSLESFYQDRGFTLFPKAYSQYAKTAMTLSHMFNFRHDYRGSEFIEPSESFGRYRMTKVAFLDGLRQRGYRLYIFQNDYLDLCYSQPRDSLECDTTKAMSLSALRGGNLSLSNRIFAIWNLFLDNSQVILRFRAAYWKVQTAVRKFGVTLPFWRPEVFHTVSISALSTLEKLDNALKDARPGDYYYAHLLLPHHPYTVDSQCQLIDPDRWIHLGTRFIAGRMGIEKKSQWSRLAPSLFYGQVSCVYQWVDQLISRLEKNELWANSIVIFHGDHGSRIGVRTPSIENFESLSKNEVLLNYSTLFAVRAPGLSAGVVDRALPINRLFDRFFNSNFSSVDVEEMSPTPEVYALESDNFIESGAQSFMTPLFYQEDRWPDLMGEASDH
ncbi:MAG: sulfatase-like hydrolase/transferase [Pseudomonadota bacterium]